MAASEAEPGMALLLLEELPDAGAEVPLGTVGALGADILPHWARNLSLKLWDILSISALPCSSRRSKLRGADLEPERKTKQKG